MADLATYSPEAPALYTHHPGQSEVFIAGSESCTNTSQNLLVKSFEKYCKYKFELAQSSTA